MTSAPDISNMTPRERADRLFNRVMLAAEQGDSAQMRFFGPMAVQAYQLIGVLDADARYHLGMIHLVNGEYAAAASQADSIMTVSPTHLLGVTLRAEVAKRTGDAKARDRAYRSLWSNYDREVATGKTEYGEHKEILERTRADAAKAAGLSR